MKTIEAIWLALVVLTVLGCIYWQWRVREHRKAAQKLADKMTIASIKADSFAFEMRWEQFFKDAAKADIKARCLANSTRTRYSRSTLRKTR